VVVAERGALVSFSDHWAEHFLDGTGALLNAELRNDLPSAVKRDRELLLDELRRQPQYGETETSQLGTATLVSRRLACVHGAVNFHDEAKLSGIEICNEARTDWHLAPELGPECTAANGDPQDLLGPRREGAEFRGALSEELLATRGCTRPKR
jgi:hypothetical protein